MLTAKRYWCSKKSDGKGVGVPSLAFLDTVENVFDSTEVKIVTTIISQIRMWNTKEMSHSHKQNEKNFPSIIISYESAEHSSQIYNE